MNKEKLEELLRRYIPVSDNKEHYDSVINILTIKIMDLYEQEKEKKKWN